MIAVKFLKQYDPYVAGDVVDLDDKLANKLIEDGTARPYQAPVLNADVVTTQEANG